MFNCFPMMLPYISPIVGGFFAVALSSEAVSNRVPMTRFLSDTTSLGALLVVLVLAAGLVGGARFFLALLR